MNIGDKLGPYEIIALIGKGGMGEVYRARDPRLGRDVAIKVSAARFSERFEREARAVAALNHPNICTLYDVGPNYLVMEYVEGENLKGPLPVDEALRIARQIVDALEAAHEKPIVHRDLKPANIKIKPDGLVKVLDFGLAKMHEPPGEEGDTIRMGLTEDGAILGTPAYMSPEQALGKKADKRSDIWAFGVVLYEMLTGERLFKGKEMGDILESVVKEQPDLSRAPNEIQRLVRRCLEKDPRKRLRDIGDVWELLESAPETQAVAPLRSRFGIVGWLVAAAAILALGFVYFRQQPQAPPTAVRFQIAAADEAGVGTPVISPDGKQVVYQGGGRLWIRSFDSLEAKPLAGTEGTVVSQQFWSADSRFVVFGAVGKLQKIEASGGPPETLCDLPGLLAGGFSTGDGRIVFGSGPGGFFQVASSGGAASPLQVARSAGELPLRALGSSPLLPDGRHFVFQNGGIYVASLDGRENAKKLLADRSQVSYVPSPAADSGYLLFLRDGTLFAQPFNPKRLELSGDPIPVAQQASGFSASPTGALLYRTGTGARKLTWFDRQGKSLGITWSPGLYTELAISPDGSRVAAVRGDEEIPDTWIHEFATETSMRLVFGAAGVKPVWSPDGSRVVVASPRAARRVDLYEKLSNGTGDEQALLSKPDAVKWPWDWSPDGRWLLYSIVDPKTKEDLWLLPMTGEHQPEPFLVTDYTETDGAFSPDGRFVAYVSDESGKFEVYVRSFPAAGGGKWMVSSGGGYQPRWRRDGKELFYFSAGGRLMSVDVAPGAAFKAGAPKFLFQAPIYGGGATTTNHYWDVAPDGKRFLINTVGGDSASTLVTVVLNWQAGLKK